MNDVWLGPEGEARHHLFLSISSISGLCVLHYSANVLMTHSSEICLKNVCETLFADKGLERSKMLT